MFRNKIGKFWLAISVLVSTAVISTPSYALPSFARQTNKACAACHFENFPMLTDYGRAFKASGFTEIYTEPTREKTDSASADMSLPLVLNAAFFGTMRFDRYSGSSTDSAGNPTYANFSDFTVPEEASLFISGRVASYVGFHSEIGLRPSAGLAAVKLPFSFPINDSMRVLVVPFAADGHGPSYGFETLNTGASDIHLTFENAAQTAAQEYLGTGDQGATGVAAVLWDPRFYVSYTRWAPTFGPAGIGSNYAPGSGVQTGKAPSANYVRAVYFVPIRGWDAAIGFQDFSGSAATPFDATAGTLYDGSRVNAVMWAIDAQVQGAIGKYPLGVYFTHGHAPASHTNQNLFNLSDPVNGIGVHAKTATTITSSFGLIPGKINISAGVLFANNGTDSSITGFTTSDNAFTGGIVYLFSQNVKFLFEITRLQHGSGHDLDGEFDTNGNPVTNVNQKMTFKLFYDL
ncbi:MAG: hypothetical protein WA446_10055 [Steroidobacteraceae bacterium]